MKALLDSGALIDLALVVLCLEVAWLVASRRRGSRGLHPLDLLGQLLAGAMLMLGLRCALTGADYRWTLAFLSASFPAHLFDLARRLRRPSKA